MRRAQLYYMRDLTGKAAHLKEVRVVTRNKAKSKAAWINREQNIAINSGNNSQTSAE